MACERPPINSNALQYASGYSVHLYCDHWCGTVDEWHSWNEFPHQFIGETWGDCAAQARKHGWLIHTKTRTATCPKCTAEK